MQPPIRACYPAVARIASLVCLACLAVLPTARAQACVHKYTNYTTCSFLNGVSADGSLARIESTKIIQADLKKNYEADPDISTRTEACWLKYVEFQCLSLASRIDKQAFGDAALDYTYSAPCASDGTRLKPCYAMCVSLYETCYKKNDLSVEKRCEAAAAAKDVTKCYGTDGVLGMKNSASSATASFAVVPLALAVARLGMSSSF